MFITKPIKKSYFVLLIALFLSSIVWANINTKHKTSTYKTEYITQTLPVPSIPNTSITPYWYDEEVQSGDNLSLVLGRLGINEHSIQNFLKESPVDTKILQLRAGQIISVRVDSHQDITDIQFFNDDDNGERNLIAIKKINGKWALNADEVATETLPSLRSVTISTSASGALARAGVPVEIRIALKEMFADKISLDQLQSGDSISVLYESLYFRGQEVATGNILAAEINTNNQVYYGYYFEEDENNGNFYDENGQALKKGFDGQPIEQYTRISSPYGIRLHPTLRTMRMHTGIDYAAPVGTKVIAPANGVVSFFGTKGGYGNTIILTHTNGSETLYAHLSAFANDLHIGKTIQTGEIIGFVGSTGRSTGPHLHYEVRINGQHINPASIALPTPQLNANHLTAFKRYRQQTDQTLSTVRGLSVIVAQKD